MMLVSLVLMFLSSCICQVADDRAYLLEFWNGLENKQVLNWDITSASICGQTGVYCAQQKVTRINMNGLQLNATIPDSIGKLSNLQQFNMQSNRLRGTLPSTIGLLNKLEQFDVSNNRLTGSVPSVIVNGAVLKRLYLQQNFFSQRIPDSLKASSLLQLYLDRNHFDCPYPVYTRKADDSVYANERCAEQCGSNICSEGQHCSISGTSYNLAFCRTPAPCSAKSPFPQTPGDTTAKVYTCPENSYGYSSSYCYGENQWFNTVESCTLCPPHSFSPFGSASANDCVCEEGYEKQNGLCVDIDECDANNCSPFATCVNSAGSYSCACKAGFEGDGVNCTDIDECENVDTCHTSASCMNTDGSYVCQCSAGYEYNSELGCIDSDECQYTGICGAQGSCFNTEGSYFCNCPTGYVLKNNNCSETARLESVMSFNPLAYWTFDSESDPTLDSTGNGNEISLEENSVVPFYHKNNPNNRAVFLSRSKIMTNNPIEFGEVFSFELVFNIDTNIQTDLISLLSPNNLDPYYSPLRFAITDIRRIQVFKGLKLLGTCSIQIPIQETHYIIFSVQRTQIVVFFNGVSIGTFPHSFIPGSYQVQVGQKFKGYIDEVAILGMPIFKRDVPFRDTEFSCDTVCPSGQLCVNRFDGQYCI